MHDLIHIAGQADLQEEMQENTLAYVDGLSDHQEFDDYDLKTQHVDEDCQAHQFVSPSGQISRRHLTATRAAGLA